MKEKIISVAALIMMGILVAASVYLPDLIAKKQDERIVGSIKVEETKKMEAIKQESTLAERLNIIGGTDGPYMTIFLNSGENLRNKAEVRTVLEQELQELDLKSYGIALPDLNEETNYSAYYYYNQENPAKNGIYWEIMFTDKPQGYLRIDDKTGKIISIVIDAAPAIDGESLAIKWGEYLGLRLNYFDPYSVSREEERASRASGSAAKKIGDWSDYSYGFYEDGMEEVTYKMLFEEAFEITVRNAY